MVIGTTGVTVRRDGRALLDGVDLDVAPGELVGVVGPNGAGKSTLLRVLAGDMAPDGGSARIDGDDVATATVQRLARLRSFVGPQSASDVLFRVRDVVAMGRHQDRRATTSEAISAAMERVDVSHLADRVMRTLSSGEQQRVNLARAIAQAAPVMLLDEPTSALDVRHQELVMAVLRALAGEGVAAVAVLHDLNLAAAHADRVLLLDSGRAAALGTPREVFTADRLSAAYAEPMAVIDHPFRDCPLVLTTRVR
ncbi:MAG: heme ABC transporter ATP-binding protein [Acidimicrobiia bacterium]|nr:heme ABC transporter ATP-binding protein [Acidimicrobiia bacterium]